MSDIQNLTAAFAALAGQGITGYHNFLCCGGCALGEAANKYDALPPAEQAAQIGAVFYHEQDAEDALDGHGLDLRYGSLPHKDDDDDRESDRAVGEKVVEALRAAGLAPEWDGDPSETIKIPRFEVTLDEVPRGEGNTLHDTYGIEEEDDESDYYEDEEDDEEDEDED